jgi:hypothetical protein
MIRQANGRMILEETGKKIDGRTVAGILRQAKREESAV